jgi:hypothetical protein
MKHTLQFDRYLILIVTFKSIGTKALFSTPIIGYAKMNSSII